MARSYRKSPAAGKFEKSNKKFKRLSNRKLRTLIKVKLKYEEQILPKLEELSDEQLSPKDEKIWFGEELSKFYKIYRK